MTSTASPTTPLRDPVLLTACAIGLACAALALVPTATYAEAFAHPQRVARLGGAIPEATTRGAGFFRIALAVAAVPAAREGFGYVSSGTWSLLGAEIPIVEHMTGLAGLPDTDFHFYAVPPKIKGFGTFPVRAFAMLGSENGE